MDLGNRMSKGGMIVLQLRKCFLHEIGLFSGGPLKRGCVQSQGDGGEVRE